MNRFLAGSTKFCLITAALAAAGVTLAQTRPTAPASRMAGTAAPGLADARGKVEVVVKLSDAPLASAQGASAKQRGLALDRGQASVHLAGLRGKQDSLMASVRALGGVEVARLSKALNAVVVSIDARQLPAVAALPGVLSVRGVKTYQRDLASTVPYVGAAAVQAGGRDGSGVRVAVLDSGVDFTHRNLGGPGTVADYNTCYAQRDVAPSGTCAGLFGPAAPKVIGGFDFVGEQWPNADRTEDPNPIDLEGHGTHVADIILGKSADGTHKGMAPGAKLYGVKVCSAVSSSCNGVALLKGMEFALDPNGDGDISDAVDIVNMSLGSSYGQAEDDLSEASANAVRFGVVVVASAGNSADRPFIVGSPSATPEVISVAQTQVPGALAFPLVVTGITPSTIGNTATVDWAPIGAGFSGPVVRLGTGCPAGSVAGQPGDDPYFNGNSPAGKVALIDRGACSISLKVDRATKAGAVAVIIANNAAGDPPSFSFGGGDLPLVPTIVISQADGNRIKAALGATGMNPGVVASVSSAVTVPLVGSMVASSSRGPSTSYSAIKPDIGAPGASVSAIAGSGNGTEAFGGTSGAAPVVSGAAALLVQAHPARSPAQIKAMLMNSAETAILTNPATQPGVLAPITRIGSGEVRVDRAIAQDAVALDAKSGIPSLSFGYGAITTKTSITRHVQVTNLSNDTRTFSVTPGFRYANDAASGAVTVAVPDSVKVNANGSRQFPVTITIDPAKLPIWSLNGGFQGGNGPLLQTVEFDGYLTLADAAGKTLSLPWQVLPHRAAAVTPSSTRVALSGGAGNVTLNNPATLDGRVDVFALTGTSPRIGKSKLPSPGDNFAVIDLRSVGVRDGGGGYLEFAVNTFGERAHPNYPAEFDVYIDANRDGIPEAVVYTLELTGFAATGQNVVAAQRLNPDGSPNGGATIYVYNDADLKSANAILAVPMAAVGVSPGTAFDFSVYAFDNYFTGALTDAIENMTFTAATPRFAAPYSVTVPAGGSTNLAVQSVPGGAAASPSQKGLLLMYRDGAPNREADGITVSP